MVVAQDKQKAHSKKWLAMAAIATLPMLSACADYTAPKVSAQLEEDTGVNPDPWEPFNRTMYKINSVLDTVLVRPLTVVYNTIVPEPGRHAVSNVLTNLRAPIDFTNSVLQGDVRNSFAVFWRFTINSTFGLAGINDVAGKEPDLRVRQADFGQTMAVYGVPSGPYLFLPLLGPSTLRDATGRGVDMAFDPTTYVGEDWRWISYAKAGALVLDFRSQNMKLVDDINQTSLDPYATYRSGYLQRRSNDIKLALDKHKFTPIPRANMSVNTPANNAGQP